MHCTSAASILNLLTATNSSAMILRSTLRPGATNPQTFLSTPMTMCGRLYRWRLNQSSPSFWYSTMSPVQKVRRQGRSFCGQTTAMRALSRFRLQRRLARNHRDAGSYDYAVAAGHPRSTNLSTNQGQLPLDIEEILLNGSKHYSPSRMETP